MTRPYHYHVHPLYPEYCLPPDMPTRRWYWSELPAIVVATGTLARAATRLQSMQQRARNDGPILLTWRYP